MILLRQPIDLFLQHRTQIPPEHLVGPFPGRNVLFGERVVRTPGRAGPGTLGNPASDPVQPTTDRVELVDGRRLADKDEKGGLESVLGLVSVVKQTLTGPQDHAAVPPDEQLKGSLVVATDKGLQQLGVGNVAGLLGAMVRRRR